jgi:hypothetical protein
MPTKTWISSEMAVFLLVFATATIFLNLDAIHFGPLALWTKFLPPTLIAVGALGTVRDIRLLRIAGWVGIALFLLVSLAASFPTEDYLLGGPNDNPADLPRTVSNANSLARVTVGLAITALLFWRYKRLQTSTEVK